MKYSSEAKKLKLIGERSIENMAALGKQKETLNISEMKWRK